VTFRGSDDFESEVLLVSELGYRYQPTDWLHSDLALFAGDYENYRSLVPTPGGTNPFDVTFDNGGTVKAYGAELSLSVQPLPYWKLRSSWTHIHRGGNERAAVVAPHQLAVLSYMELPGRLELDAGLYYTGRIMVAEQPPEVKIPGFWRLDLRLGWSPRPTLDFELVGQNLTDRRHAEYAHLNVRTAAPLAELGTRYNELPRAFYAQVTWRF
jgi:iron complex outermembrane receptor protein